MLEIQPCLYHVVSCSSTCIPTQQPPTTMGLLDEYIEQRDRLIQRKNDLLKQQKTRTKQQSTQSKQTSKRRKIDTVSRTMETYKYSTSLISKYSRLPEMDMDRRLQYAHMTCPWMTVDETKKKIKPAKGRKGKNNNIMYSIKLNFDTCGEFLVELDINIENESVNKLNIKPQSDIKTIDERTSISTLISESTKSSDISRFVYGMNTLLRMRHKRKREFMSILDEIDFKKVASINGFPTFKVESKDTLKSVLFEHSPSYIEFELTSNKTLRIDWNIKFQSGRRHCVSDLVGTIIQNNNIENITKLLKNLIKANDIKSAVLQILKIL